VPAAESNHRFTFLAEGLMSATASIAHEPTLPAAARRADPWIVTTLLSLETLFVLFLMAGRYKADPRFAWITEWTSLDITALTFGASGLAALLVILRRGYRLPAAAPAVLFGAGALFGYAVLSMAWTPGAVYAQSKALHVGVLTSGTLVICAGVIASRRYRVARLLFLLVLFCVWLSIESVLSYQAAGDGRSVTALGGEYLGLGRMIGAAALVALGYGLFFAQPGIARAGSLALFVAFCGVLLILGGRMPLLATAAGALVPLVIMLVLHPHYTRRLARWTYWLLLVVAGIVLVYLFASPNAPQTLRRMTLLVDGSLGSSAQGRLECYEAAVRLWWERPLLGHGLGAWPLLYLQSDVRAYPHNLVLELLVELGLCGLVLFGTVMVAAMRSLGSLRRIAADPLRMTILMMLIGALGNAMVSGDLSDNRFLFGVLGLACLPRQGRKSP
jgi:O-antigen ligase